VINAIIGLGHTLGLKVVAEGVEHAADAGQLRAAGCDELQGFHYSRPLPAEQAQQWIRAHASASATGPSLRLA
jgi:EAL domain-containing protein (putative c-di-GMP-specific phosphodiesterase class I)